VSIIDRITSTALTPREQESASRVQGRVLYLLLGAAFVTLIYPMSEAGFVPAMIYLVLFCVFFGLGVAFIAAGRHSVWLGLVGGALQTLLGVYYLTQAYAGTLNPVITLALFGGFIVFDVILIVALLEFVFIETRRMSNAVIYAAITAYILIGYMFAPIYMCIETLTRLNSSEGAFLISYAPEVALTWQKFVYYSFVTLATLGYGDILPLTSWAQAFAAFEAVVGVLFIAILVGRLVGLSGSRET